MAFWPYNRNFAAVQKSVNHTNIKSIISGIVMFLILSWLTICLPAVNEANQTKANVDISNTINDDNPLTGTSEEKTPNAPTSNLNEEFIHHSDRDFSLIPFQVSLAYIHAHESTYIAYHGEPMCPPPNTLS